MLMQFEANPYYQSDSRDVDNLAFSWVRDITFVPDGSAVLSVSGDGTVREWQTATGTLNQDTQIAPLFTAAWSPFSGRLAVWRPTAQKAADLSSGQAFDPSTGEFTIAVPLASLERLQAIANACDAPAEIRQTLSASPPADQLTGFVGQVEALPEGTIPPACAADLLAVAEALQNQ
jgi:WD40 repeat protein